MSLTRQVENEVEQHAERLVYETDLEKDAAYLVAAEAHDAEIGDGELATHMGYAAYSPMGVQELRSKLRRRKLELEDEIEEKKATADALDAL